jgi:hypothetical protein
MKRFIPLLFAVQLILCGGGTAWAELIGGVEFPSGAVSSADSVVSFDPAIKSGQPTSQYLDPSKALGVPDSSGTYYVSLGDGGSITLRFTDNSLTGSGNTNFDLWIFEIGPDVEDTFVSISKNGINWYSVGKVTGGTRGIDIDAYLATYGFGQSDKFSYVRLTDDTNEGDQTGNTVGADINAVGAISSSTPAAVPIPSAIYLFAPGLAGLAMIRRRFKR